MNQDESRFRAKIEKHPGSSCWWWGAALDKDGYGRFTIKGRNVSAARWAYERWIGPVPEGLELDHLCRNHACVRPSHLEAVSHRINVLREQAQAAKQSRQTHCLRQHPLSGTNLYIAPDQHRRCRTCRREYMRHYQRKAS